MACQLGLPNKVVDPLKEMGAAPGTLVAGLSARDGHRNRNIHFNTAWLAFYCSQIVRDFKKRWPASVEYKRDRINFGP